MFKLKSECYFPLQSCWSNLKPILLTAISIAIIVSCEKKPVDNNIVTNAMSPYDYAHIIVQEDNIISEVYEEDDSLILQLEKGNHFSIATSHIKNYEIDHVSWMMTVNFTDTTQLNLYYFGDSLSTDDIGINVNPYDYAPLTALIDFQTPLPRNIRIRVQKKSDLGADISHSFHNFTRDHEIPVFGLYVGYMNTIYIDILDAHDNAHITKSLHIETEKYLRPLAGFMTVITNNFSDRQKNRLFFIENCIYDGAGDIRWYTNWLGARYYTLSSNKIAIQIHSDRCTRAYPPHIRIIDYFGKEIATYEVPNRNHHEINEKTPGGNLLVASNAQPSNKCSEDTEDYIVEIDRKTGEVVKEWDLTQIFDSTRPRLFIAEVNDWCHLNSIQYDSTDNTLLISSKLQYFISKIDYETGAIKWILGSPKDWGEKWLPYLLHPINFDTLQDPYQDFPYAQHMPRLTKAGTIMVYDNGWARPGEDYTRAVEFKVYPENMTVEKIWEHRVDENVAKRVGSIHVYSDETVQIGHGNNGYTFVVDRIGNVLFKGYMNGKVYYRAYDIKFYD